MRKQRGFTLIELMVTVAIAAIVLTLGVPSFRDLIQNNRVASTVNGLVTALQLARSEAIKRGGNITLCSSTNGTTCANSNTWTSGWIVTTDGADSTKVMRAWPNPGSGQTLTANAPEVVYRSTGSLVTAATTFTLGFDGCTGTRAREIDVATTGRPKTSSVTCP